MCQQKMSGKFFEDKILFKVFVGNTLLTEVIHYCLFCEIVNSKQG